MGLGGLLLREGDDVGPGGREHRGGAAQVSSIPGGLGGRFVAKDHGREGEGGGRGEELAREGAPGGDGFAVLAEAEAVVASLAADVDLAGAPLGKGGEEIGEVPMAALEAIGLADGEAADFR